MAKDYTKNVATAVRIIEKNGRLLTFGKESLVDEVEGEPAGPPEEEVTEFTAIGAVFDIDFEDIVGELSREGTKTVYLAAGSANVIGKDLREYEYVTDNSATNRIVSAVPLEPGDTTIMWTLIIKGGS